MSSVPAANKQCDEQTSRNQTPSEVGHHQQTYRHFASPSPIESTSSSSSSTLLAREPLLSSPTTLQPLIGRLHKTRNSTIYFSDSDDVDGAQTTTTTAGAVDCGPTAPPRRFATASRFQQQHHRRHRQFHRTLAPLELLPHTTSSDHQQQRQQQQQSAKTVGAIAEEESTDDDNNDVKGGGDVHRATTGSSTARLRESPAHLRHKHHATGATTLRRSVSRSPTKQRPKLAELAAPPRSPKRPGDGGCVAMLLTYGAETICMLALILTTLATFQNAPPKLSRLAAAPAFFASGSLVHDFPAGNLELVQNRVKSADISLVFFYAPWSADCQHARTSYEQTARLFYRSVYFAAVNCWQPGGECRGQYSKIHEWPVAMAYFQTGLAVPYTGRWSTASVVRFVRALQRPLQRVIDNDDMLRLMMSHDAVVVGFLVDPLADDAQLYETFYTTAVKWLERDPFQSVAFAVVTGAAVQTFGVQRSLARLYQWNGTVEQEFMTQPRMQVWLDQNMIRVSRWLQPPGTKASTMAPHFRAGPVLMLFTPRNAVASVPGANDAYDMLRQVALDYNNCASVNQPWIAEMSRVYITHVRDENRRAHAAFMAECVRMREASEAAARLEAKCLATGGGSGKDGSDRAAGHQHQHVASVVFGNIVNSSKLPSGSASLPRCTIGPRNVHDICDADRQPVCGQESESLESCAAQAAFTGQALAPITSMLDAAGDERSPVHLRRLETRKLCELHAAGELLVDYPRVQFFEVADWSQFDRVAEQGCARNRTLSFVAVDSALYHVFAERMGVDVLNSPQRTAAVILDHELETSYVHNGPVTTHSLVDFVYNYTMLKLPRHLLSESDPIRDKTVRHARVDLPPTAYSEDFPKRLHTAVELRDIDSQSFADVVLNSNKTVFVLFHSLQCALCAPMAHSLLLAAHLLDGLRTHIDVVRIDGDRNDLPWQYTVDRLPSLIAFPPGARSVDSRIYPSALAATVPNVLSFVLANVERPVRLHGMVLVCNGVRTKFGLSADCGRTIRTEIRDDIAFSLRQWRNQSHLRGGIMRRLQALTRLLLQTHRSDAGDDVTLLDLVHTVRKVWPTAHT